MIFFFHNFPERGKSLELINFYEEFSCMHEMRKWIADICWTINSPKNLLSLLQPNRSIFRSCPTTEAHDSHTLSMCVCLIKYALKNSIQRKQPTTLSSHVETAAPKKGEKHSKVPTHTFSSAHTLMWASNGKSYLFVSFPRSLCYRQCLWRHLRSRKTIIIIHPMHLNSCLASASLSHNQQLIMYDWWKKWSETAQLLPRINERAACYTSVSLSHTHPNRRHVCEDPQYSIFTFNAHTAAEWHGVKCWSVIHTRAFDTRWISDPAAARRSHGIERHCESTAWERQWTTIWRV